MASGFLGGWLCFSYLQYTIHHVTEASDSWEEKESPVPTSHTQTTFHYALSPKGPSLHHTASNWGPGLEHLSI